MKTLSFFLLFALTITSSSFASGATTASPKPLPSAQPEMINLEGFCFIGAGATILTPAPCVNLLLILNDDKNVELSRTRTSSQGVFEFSTENGKVYHIVSGSKFYEVVAPRAVRGGDTKMNIQMQQK